MTSLPELEERRRKVQETFSKADAALHHGKITQGERDALLAHYYGTATERVVLAQIDSQAEKLRGDRQSDHRVPALIIGFMLLMIAMFATMFFSTGGITGAVTYGESVTIHNITASTAVELNLSNVTSINVSGMAAGAGNIIITLEKEGERSMIHEHRRGSAQTAHAQMDRTWYSEGETVSYTTTAASTYLMAEQATLLDSTSIAGLAAGTYTLKFLINETDPGTGQNAILEESISFTVGGTPDEAFNSCGELCNTFLDGPATLRITIEGDATLQDATISLRRKANSPPRLATAIPDMAGESSVAIDMGAYFTDEDGDMLLYDSTRHDGTVESWDDDVLSISGPAGTYTYIIYASDMADLTPSNIFSVTITAPPATGEPVPSNETSEIPEGTSQNGSAVPPQQADETGDGISNATVNSTGNNTGSGEGNGTGDAGNITAGGATGNITGNTSTTLDCSAPNPNDRPEECLLITDEYNLDEGIYWENADRVHVARFTILGNLLIKGDIIERSTAAPGPRDFAIGHTDDNYAFQHTVWIDTGTGDLHLRGRLIEENGNLDPPTGAYTVTTKRRVYLAHIDIASGDLYLRGNAIPYRRSFG